MNQEVDYSLCKKYGYPKRRGMTIANSMNKINEVVIHHTDGGGNWRGLLGWFLNPGQAKEALFKRWIGFTHYYIERDGTIIKAFPLTRWMYHSCSGKLDKFTIGIELFHKTGLFTDEQYDSLVQVIADLFMAENLNIEVVSSHDYRYQKYSGKSKGCPGADFDWRYLKDRLEHSGFSGITFNF